MNDRAVPKKKNLNRNGFASSLKTLLNQDNITKPRRSERLVNNIKRKSNAMGNFFTAPKKATAKRANTNQKFVEKLNQHDCDNTPDYFESNFTCLTTINEDCLLHIVHYLNIVDVVNMAATCSWLQYFARTVIYPQKAIEICVDASYLSRSVGALTATLFTPCDNTRSSKLTLQSIETAFFHFGEFVKDLKFKSIPYGSCGFRIEKSEIWVSCENILKHCQNLKTLRFQKYEFRKTNTLALQGIIKKMPSLTELNFRSCFGLTNNWPSIPFKRRSNVRTLTVSATNHLSRNFFKFYNELSSLTIDVCSWTVWQAYDFVQIFNNTGDHLKHLKLSNLYNLNGYELVGRIITKKLLNLESLELEILLNENTEYMTELPHLKSLKIHCNDRKINSLLQSLSANGIIKKMVINNGIFVNEDRTAPPLIFNKLESFAFYTMENMSSFMQTMTRSEMPVLYRLVIWYSKNTQIDESVLLRFIDSKKTLKSLYLNFDCCNPFEPFAFVRQLINILKKPSSPRRAFLNLRIRPLKLGVKEMELLNESRHLLKVKVGI